jgi:hypothetical protein
VARVIAIDGWLTYISPMEQELIRPEGQPKLTNQAFSPLGCALAAIGAALSTLSLLGAAFAAAAWAVSRLLGLPDTALYVLLGLVMIPAIWAAAWAGGRAWYVEHRLAAGRDVDTPVFKLKHYLSRL